MLEQIISDYVNNEKALELLETNKVGLRAKIQSLCPNNYEDTLVKIWYKSSAGGYIHPKKVQDQIEKLKASIKKIEEASIKKGLATLKPTKQQINISIK